MPPTTQLSFFFFSSRRRHTRWTGDWSSDVCSSDLDLSQLPALPDEPSPSLLGRMMDWARQGCASVGRRLSSLLSGTPRDASPDLQQGEIGRASCRERVEMAVGVGAVHGEGVERTMM